MTRVGLLIRKDVLMQISSTGQERAELRNHLAQPLVKISYLGVRLKQIRGPQEIQPLGDLGREHAGRESGGIPITVPHRGIRKGASNHTVAQA